MTRCTRVRSQGLGLLVVENSCTGGSRQSHIRSDDILHCILHAVTWSTMAGKIDRRMMSISLDQDGESFA